MQHLGITEVFSWREAQAAGLLNCDSQGCLVQRQALSIAISATTAGALEDCQRADFVVAREPLRRTDCEAPLGALDLYDLLDQGTTALYLREEGGVTIEGVESLRGVRPWSHPLP